MPLLKPHRRTFMKPFMRDSSAEFCASCHKVHLDVPVNKYRWFRGFNEYDNWQASGISGQGRDRFTTRRSPAIALTAICRWYLLTTQAISAGRFIRTASQARIRRFRL